MATITIQEHTGDPSPVAAVLRQLRPSYGSDQELASALRALTKGAGVRVYGAHLGGAPVAAGAITVRLVENLVHGKFLFIDDLVTDQSQRRQGLATALFDHADSLAAAAGIPGRIQLNSGVGEQRADAHGFYFGRGLRIASYAFAPRSAG